MLLCSLPKPMPLAAVMYVYIEEYQPDSFMAELGVELMRKFDLTSENFHAGGPLVYLPREDYDLAHVVGEPGYLLDVNIRGSYYGVGYERGDLPLFVGIAEWLEQKLPGCRVLYGEDCSGEGYPFDEPLRAALMEYRRNVGYVYFRKDLSREQEEEIRARHSADVLTLRQRK